MNLVLNLNNEKKETCIWKINTFASLCSILLFATLYSVNKYGVLLVEGSDPVGSSVLFTGLLFLGMYGLMHLISSSHRLYNAWLTPIIALSGFALIYPSALLEQYVSHEALAIRLLGGTAMVASGLIVSASAQEHEYDYASEIDPWWLVPMIKAGFAVVLGFVFFSIIQLS